MPASSTSSEAHKSVYRLSRRLVCVLATVFLLLFAAVALQQALGVRVMAYYAVFGQDIGGLEKVARCGPWEPRAETPGRSEGRYRSFEADLHSAVVIGEQEDLGGGSVHVYVRQTHIKRGPLAIRIAGLFLVMAAYFWPVALLLIWGWRWTKSKLFPPPARGFDVIMKERP